MALITDLPAASSLATTDLLIKDTGSATQKIAVSNAYADATHAGLVSTGSQSFAGSKVFRAGAITVTSQNTGSAYFSFEDPDGNSSAYIRNNNDQHRLQFLKRSYNSSTNAQLGTFENYILPNVDADRAASADYTILTSKTPVTIAQGGTGQTGLTSVTLTANSNVSIDSNILKRWGKLISGSVRITVSSTLATYSNIISGLPSTVGQLGVTLLTTGKIPTQYHAYTSDAGTDLKAANSIPAGTYDLILCYMSY